MTSRFPGTAAPVLEDCDSLLQTPGPEWSRVTSAELAYARDGFFVSCSTERLSKFPIDRCRTKGRRKYYRSSVQTHRDIFP